MITNELLLTACDLHVENTIVLKKTLEVVSKEKNEAWAKLEEVCHTIATLREWQCKACRHWVHSLGYCELDAKCDLYKLCDQATLKQQKEN